MGRGGGEARIDFSTNNDQPLPLVTNEINDAIIIGISLKMTNIPIFHQFEGG